MKKYAVFKVQNGNNTYLAEVLKPLLNEEGEIEDYFAKLITNGRYLKEGMLGSFSKDSVVSWHDDLDEALEALAWERL